MTADHVTDRLLAWLHGGSSEQDVFDDLRQHAWRLGDIDEPLRQALAFDLHCVLVQLRQTAASCEEERPPTCAPTARNRETACYGLRACGQHRAHGDEWMLALLEYVSQVTHGTPRRAMAAVKERRTA